MSLGLAVPRKVYLEELLATAALYFQAAVIAVVGDFGAASSSVTATTTTIDSFLVYFFLERRRVHQVVLHRLQVAVPPLALPSATEVQVLSRCIRPQPEDGHRHVFQHQLLLLLLLAAVDIRQVGL
jgi:hypothetical protein